VFIEVAGPEGLELTLQQEEEEILSRRRSLDQLIHSLRGPEHQDDAGFYIKTYYGIAGLKQMLWNELSMHSESLQFTKESLNELAGAVFADKFRAEIINRDIKQRALENVRGTTKSATKLDNYMEHYSVRVIAKDVLDIRQELTIHDDIVSVYNWEDKLYVGTETRNAHYANFMRQIFENYWRLAEA
jgi:hypothetical protein